MSGSKFSIQAAIRNGYLFVGREWPYLVRLSLLPFGVTLVIDVAIYLERPEGLTFLEDFLYSLPSVMLMAWLMFMEARLLLLNERPSLLPADPASLLDRRRALSASVMIWILFIMARAMIANYLYWSRDNDSFLTRGTALIVFSLGFWGARFCVANILAAVEYPIRRYIFQVNGVDISLRLIALYILTCLPVVVVAAGLLTMILPQQSPDRIQLGAAATLEAASNLPLQGALMMQLMLAFLDIVTGILSTATFCYALKEILGRPQQEKHA